MKLLSPTGGRRNINGAVCMAALLLTFCSALGNSSAQESWQYSPYSIQVWFASESQPEFTAQLKKRLEIIFQQQTWAVAGATWRLATADAPPAISTLMLRDPDSLTFEQLVASDPTLEERDKLMLVTLTKAAGQYQISARELDIRTRLFGPTIGFQISQRELIPQEAFRAVTAAFAPIGRIDDVRDGVAAVRIRAGGLVTGDSNPSAVGPGHVLFAVLRQNSRRSNQAPNIRVVEWTLLEVTESNEGFAKCQVHTANKAYLSGRSSSRIERLALGLRVTNPSTTLEVVSRDERKKPLVGYYIYSKDPKTEEVELLGQTDWRGQLEVFPSDKTNVQLLYVRSGDALLARLPLVAGQTQLARAELTDDEIRLQAEALVRGIQSTLVDLVARRELLAARIRKYITDGRLDDAKTLMEQLRKLPTVTDLLERIDEAQQTAKSENPKVQARIDIMFAETRELVAKFVNPKLIDDLSLELGNAQRTQPAAGTGGS